MSNTTSTAPAQIAVWLFIGATFAFSWSALYGDVSVWLRGALMILGFVLIVAGGVRLGIELRARRDAAATPPPSEPEA